MQPSGRGANRPATQLKSAAWPYCGYAPVINGGGEDNARPAPCAQPSHASAPAHASAAATVAACLSLGMRRQPFGQFRRLLPLRPAARRRSGRIYPIVLIPRHRDSKRIRARVPGLVDGTAQEHDGERCGATTRRGRRSSHESRGFPLKHTSVVSSLAGSVGVRAALGSAGLRAC
jgi:hypothetical protein